MLSTDYAVITITEALVDRVEYLKVELEAQRQVIAALREERVSQGDESEQEQYLAGALFDILEVLADKSDSVESRLAYVKNIAREALELSNYNMEAPK